MNLRPPTLPALLLGLALGVVGNMPTQAAETESADPNPTFFPADAPRISVGNRREVERHFDTLTIGELVFTNVWVHRQTNFNILIRHQGGIDTVKLTDLPKEELAALRPQLGDLANIEEEKEPELVTRFRALQANEEMRLQMAEQIEVARKLVLALLLPVVAVLVLVHLLMSFYIHMLCKKTKTKGGFEVWLPLFNGAPLLRAAGLPGVWALLGIMAPLVPVAVFSGQLVAADSFPGLVVVGISGLLSLATGIVWIVWCFKICVARQKPGWLGILFFVPVVNLAMFTYLAFSE